MASEGRRATGPTVTGPSLVSMPPPEGMLDRNLKEIHQAISQRAYEICKSRGFTAGNDLDDWFSAESELFRFVPVEVIDDENEVRVVADVPGFNPKDLSIQLESNRLLIRGKKEQTEQRQKGNVSYSERLASEIFRVVNLPSEVDAEQATAVVSDGVLELNLPKTEHSKSKRLQVKAA